MPFALSTRGHYAVLFMYELARTGNSYASLKDIASRQRVSQGYLEQIVGPLRETGLVVSRRGFGGGYSLAKSPRDVTVGEIVRAVEGPVVPVKCVSDDPVPDTCPDNCQARAVWQKVGEAIDSVLDSFTLEDLVSE
ncbi:MAG: RrF2 family transcriptional regulator [Bacillota bacterium]|jgi:Rrf2 family cysteine metabolism transcriptional repressor